MLSALLNSKDLGVILELFHLPADVNNPFKLLVVVGISCEPSFTCDPSIFETWVRLQGGQSDGVDVGLLSSLGFNSFSSCSTKQFTMGQQDVFEFANSKDSKLLLLSSSALELPTLSLSEAAAAAIDEDRTSKILLTQLSDFESVLILIIEPFVTSLD